MHALIEKKVFERPPARVGRFDVISRLAEGGMGEILLARDPASGEECVVKRVRPGLSHPAVRLRFMREARVAAYMRHPNIARFVDASVHGRELFIAFELISGHTLEDVMRRVLEYGMVIPQKIVRAVADAALGALDYVHDLSNAEGKPLGIVHRDLSPRNIMISYSGDVKLIDFGVTKSRDDGFRTAPGALVGTLAYMSPEAATGLAADRRSDVYSLAIVLHEALTGRRLVRGSSALEIVEEHVHRVPEPPSKANPRVSFELDSVIMKALAKDPKERWSSANAFREALRVAPPCEIASKDDLGRCVRRLFAAEEQLFRLRRGQHDRKLGPALFG